MLPTRQELSPKIQRTSQFSLLKAQMNGNVLKLLPRSWNLRKLNSYDGQRVLTNESRGEKVKCRFSTFCIFLMITKMTKNPLFLQGQPHITTHISTPNNTMKGEKMYSP